MKWKTMKDYRSVGICIGGINWKHVQQWIIEDDRLNITNSKGILLYTLHSVYGEIYLKKCQSISLGITWRVMILYEIRGCEAVI